MMLSNLPAVSAALLQCFNNDGDCIVVVNPTDGREATSDNESSPTKKRKKYNDEAPATAQFRVYSKLLCSWSSVLDAILFTQKSDKKKVEIRDFSVAAVEAFLRFMYSGNLDGGAGVVVEVAGLADKYFVAELQELCQRSWPMQLSPETACEMLEAADRIGSSTIKDHCLEMIFSAAPEALPGAFVLSSNVLSEALTSTCISDFQLAMIMLQWCKHPAAKTFVQDIPSLLQEHVHIAAFTEDEYSKAKAFADAVGCGSAIETMWRQVKRGDIKRTSNFFGSLWDKYRWQFRKTGSSASLPPFLGYWLNMIPSRASFGTIAIGSQNNHLYGFEQYARQGYACLSANDEMKWMAPHHAIYVSGVSFSSALGDGNRIEVFSSQDGTCWQKLMDSGVRSEVNKEAVTVACRSKGWAKWFKLCVREGDYSNYLRIHGVLQVL